MAICPNFNYSTVLPLFSLPAQNSQGWSIITPAADSRLIYVDPVGGNDGTGTDYLLSNLPNVDNWNDPGAINAYQTFDAAYARTRAGFPDWILIKRGTELSLSQNYDLKGGRSTAERMFVTSYGVGALPHINATSAKTIRIFSDVHNIGIVGIKVYPTYRDPDHVDFAGWGNTSGTAGLSLYNGLDGNTGILLEGNWLEFNADGINMTSDTGSTEAHSDVIIRRNIILHAYDEFAHSQGLFTGSSSHLIEENFLYHNGWYKQAIDPGDPSYPGDPDLEGQATLFNHNMYLSSLKNSIVRNNISVSPSSIHVKTTANSSGGVNDTITAWNIIGDNNLMIDGEVGLSLGGNTDYDTGSRYQDIRFARDVMIGMGASNPTDRNLAWGPDCQDWDGGFIGQELIVKSDPAIGNIRGINLSGHCVDVASTRHVIYDLGKASGTGGKGCLDFDAQGANMVNVLNANNLIQCPNTDARIVGNHDLITGITHRDNKYDTQRTAAEQFEYNGLDRTKAQWDTDSGDTGSTMTAVTFVDASRDIESYMTSLGQTATLDEFIAKCKLQIDGNWDRDYSARYINAYFRAGYKEA